MRSLLNTWSVETLAQALFNSPVGQNYPTEKRWIVALALVFCWPQVLAVELLLEGQFIQGGLVHGITEPGSKVSVNATPIRVSPHGLFLVGFGRDEPREVLLKIVSPAHGEVTKVLIVARREYAIQRIDGLAPQKVNPDEKALTRIHAEAALIVAARTRDDPRTDFLTGFMWPAKGSISGVYGSQRILNGEPRRPHFGIDIATPIGTPVFAPADGIVSLVHNDMFFSGGTLVLDHGHGLSSAFLHLSKILVVPEQMIARGDVIAEVGATGRVTGAHLDWRINLFQRRLDPQLLVNPMGP